VAVGAEQRVRELGLAIQDFSAEPYAGVRYATSMKPHHQVGNLLLLGGHVPERADGTLLHPGKLGADVSVEQGVEAARLMACNCLAGIRHAVGSLDRVKHLARSLNFVATAADFYDIYLVANGATVTAYDPAVPSSRQSPDLEGIEVRDDPFAACEGAQVLVVLTEWDEFRWLDVDKLADLMAARKVVAARNLLDRAAFARRGFDYLGVGRS